MIKFIKKILCEHEYEELGIEKYYSTQSVHERYCIYCPKCTKKRKLNYREVAANLIKQSKLRNKYLSDKKNDRKSKFILRKEVVYEKGKA